MQLVPSIPADTLPRPGHFHTGGGLEQAFISSERGSRSKLVWGLGAVGKNTLCALKQLPSWYLPDTNMSPGTHPLEEDLASTYPSGLHGNLSMYQDITAQELPCVAPPCFPPCPKLFFHWWGTNTHVQPQIRTHPAAFPVRLGLSAVEMWLVLPQQQVSGDCIQPRSRPLLCQTNSSWHETLLFPHPQQHFGRTGSRAMSKVLCYPKKAKTTPPVWLFPS